jgi:hypothetical protein
MTTDPSSDAWGAGAPRTPAPPAARHRGSTGRDHELAAQRAHASIAGLPAGGAPEPPAKARAQHSRRRGVTTAAVTATAAFLAVLTVLALQLRANPASVGIATQKPRVVILRRVYQTTVRERIIGAAGKGGTTVSSSSASVSGAAAPASTPITTHTS